MKNTLIAAVAWTFAALIGGLWWGDPFAEATGWSPTLTFFLSAAAWAGLAAFLSLTAASYAPEGKRSDPFALASFGFVIVSGFGFWAFADDATDRIAQLGNKIPGFSMPEIFDNGRQTCRNKAVVFLTALDQPSQESWRASIDTLSDDTAAMGGLGMLTIGHIKGNLGRTILKTLTGIGKGARPFYDDKKLEERWVPELNKLDEGEPMADGREFFRDVFEHMVKEHPKGMKEVFASMKNSADAKKNRKGGMTESPQDFVSALKLKKSEEGHWDFIAKNRVQNKMQEEVIGSCIKEDGAWRISVAMDWMENASQQ